MRKAKFKVSGRFDGAVLATVVIEYHSPDLALIKVRPFRRRKTFELLLSDVARGIVYDCVKKELAEKKKLKKVRRGR